MAGSPRFRSLNSLMGFERSWALRGKMFFSQCLIISWLFLACSPSQDSQEKISSDPMGKVEKVDGEVLVTRLGARDVVHLHMGDPLFGGDMVSTEAGGATEIRLGQDSLLSVTSGSIIRINPTLDPKVGISSFFLQRGRVLVKIPTDSKSPGVVLETFHLKALFRSGELEAGLAEDLGLMICMRRGQAQIEGVGAKISLAAKQETEVEFLEAPPQSRQLNERSEADWAAWMAARFRNLPLKIHELAAKIDRCLKETAIERLQLRTELDRRHLELESLARSLAEEEQGPPVERQVVLRKLRALAELQEDSLVRLRHLGTRTELLLVEAERLRRRADNMKKELGEKHSNLGNFFKLLLEGGRPLAKALAEERNYLAFQTAQWKSVVDMAGGLPLGQMEEEASQPAKASDEGKKTTVKPSEKQNVKAGSVSKSPAPKSSTGGTASQTQKTKKSSPASGQKAEKPTKKSSSGGKVTAGGSSSKKPQSQTTQKENRTKGTNP
ncbi:MAG: hypothetical protein WHX93_02865 [bacterium]